MPLVKVGRSGQITIPKEMRTILGIQEGDVLEIGIQGGSIILKPGNTADTDPAGRRFFEVVDEIRAGMEDADPGQFVGWVERSETHHIGSYLIPAGLCRRNQGLDVNTPVVKARHATLIRPCTARISDRRHRGSLDLCHTACILHHMNRSFKGKKRMEER